MIRNGIDVSRVRRFKRYSPRADKFALPIHMSGVQYELIHKLLLLSRVIHGDDTGTKLPVPGALARRRRTWARTPGAPVTRVSCSTSPRVVRPPGRHTSSRATRGISRRRRWPSTRGSTARTRSSTCAASRMPGASSWPRATPETGRPRRLWSCSAGCIRSSGRCPTCSPVRRPGATGTAPAARGAPTGPATAGRRAGVGRTVDVAGRTEAGRVAEVAAGGRRSDTPGTTETR